MLRKGYVTDEYTFTQYLAKALVAKYLPEPDPNDPLAPPWTYQEMKLLLK